MDDRYLQYVPIVGLPSACRNLERVGLENSVFEASSLEEWGRGVFNYPNFAAICVENLAVVGGLAYLCS